MADIGLQKTAETAAGADLSAAAEAASPVNLARLTAPSSAPQLPVAQGSLPKMRGRPFGKGQSGNPAGRPRGSVNSATRAAMLLLDGEAEALTRKAIELALAGDAGALRLCLDRIVGVRRGRPVDLPGASDLPPVSDARDLAVAMAAVMEAAAQGAITPDEALALAQTAESCARTLEAAHVARHRHWRGVFFREWLKESGNRIPWPWPRRRGAQTGFRDGNWAKTGTLPPAGRRRRER